MEKKKMFNYISVFLLGLVFVFGFSTALFTSFKTEALFIPSLVTLLYFTLIFVVAQIIKDNSIVDMGWGLGFVIGSWTTLLTTKNPTKLSYFIVIFITVWGLRLTYRIIKRNIGKPEDFRYKAWRVEWGDNVMFIAFFRVFMLQAFINFFVGSASYAIIKYNDFVFKGFSLVLVIIGLLISLIGLFFEVVGDEELRRHMKKKNGKILDTGLWRLTRHPNYFGEIAIWSGLYIAGLSLLVTNSINPVYYIIMILSPVIMSTVLLKVSIPLLENSMEKIDGYSLYKKNTPKIFPFTKKG